MQLEDTRYLIARVIWRVMCLGFTCQFKLKGGRGKSKPSLHEFARKPPGQTRDLRTTLMGT
eukprot:scaffold461_cov321-Pavlova_lutheri.AAC.19